RGRLHAQAPTARQRGHDRAGQRGPEAPPRPRQADDRLVSAGGAAGVTTVVTRGLSPVRQVLPNGAVVLVQETAFSPAVTISASFRAGSLYEPDDLTGLAWLLGRVIDRGTATRSADTIAEALDDRGVALRVSTNPHVLTVSCTCISEDFPDILTHM